MEGVTKVGSVMVTVLKISHPVKSEVVMVYVPEEKPESVSVEDIPESQL